MISWWLFALVVGALSPLWVRALSERWQRATRQRTERLLERARADSTRPDPP